MLFSDAGSNDGLRQILADHERRINALYTARTAEATTIGAGGIIVKGGDGITIEDGGALTAEYPSGRAAAHFGPLTIEGTDIPDGHGLLVQADDDSAGRDVFRAKYVGGQRKVTIGQTPTADASGAVDSFVADAMAHSLHSHGPLGFVIHSHHGGDVTVQSSDGGLINIQSNDGAEVQILSDARLWLFADGDLDVDVNGELLGQVSGDIRWLADGIGALGGDAGTFLQPQSGSGTANVRMDTTTGQITWVASTERVKHDIQDLVVDPAAVLGLRPRTWLPGQTARQCPEWMHAQHPDGECHAGEPVDPPPDAPREVGFVAEEIDALGLAQFVEYDADGLPISIRYDRLAAALVPVVQQQQAQITALTEQLAVLSDRVAALEPAPPDA